MMFQKSQQEFTSALTKKELCFAGAGLVLHIYLLPIIFIKLIDAGVLGETAGNFAVYAVMAAYVLAFAWKFLRRDFDALADRPVAVAVEILRGYFVMLCLNFLVSLILTYVENGANPNNEAIFEMVAESSGPTTAMAVFLAPIIEEVLFRAGIFGAVRKLNRVAAYAVCAAAFAAYHLWAYIMQDASYAVYLVQYIPAALILCRIYERSNTIWCPIGMHMLVNYISLEMMDALKEMV